VQLWEILKRDKVAPALQSTPGFCSVADETGGVPTMSLHMKRVAVASDAVTLACTQGFFIRMV
jgi:hypothetical protein